MICHFDEQGIDSNKVDVFYENNSISSINEYSCQDCSPDNCEIEENSWVNELKLTKPQPIVQDLPLSVLLFLNLLSRLDLYFLHYENHKWYFNYDSSNNLFVSFNCFRHYLLQCPVIIC